VREISRRQLNSIKRSFQEKELWQKRQAEKFRHRAPSGDARKKESLVRLFADRVDFILIVASFTLPPLKRGLIDRFLLTAFLEEIAPVIVFNKADLLPSRQEGEKELSLYRSLGYHALMPS
jgi:putative ribosome biogenesis GTPase RsgA